MRQVTPKRSVPVCGLAIASVAMAWLALWTCVIGVGLFFGIAAVACGALALRPIRAGKESGRGLALTGLIVGSLALLLSTGGAGYWGMKGYRLYQKAQPTREQKALIRELKTTRPDAAHARLLELWSEGQQKDVEAALKVLVKQHPRHQSLRFFQAACFRSRGERETSKPVFQRVQRLNAHSPKGKASRHLACLATGGKEQEQHFEGLRELVRENPDDLLIRWMLGLQCRSYKKYEEGKAIYEELLGRMTNAPSMIHHTYANILEDGFDLYEEALPHRKRVAELEPEDWTYRALADTLVELERHEEAVQAYAKSLELNPQSAKTLAYWGNALRQSKQYEAALEKFNEALALNENYEYALNEKGYCLTLMARHKEALEIYQASASNGNAWAMRQIADCHFEGNGVPQDDKASAEWRRKAAEAGDQYAMSGMGWHYRHGRGVPKDIETAKNWYRKAADQEYPYAMRWLGDICQYESPNNLDEAIYWYMKASALSHAEADNALAWMCAIHPNPQPFYKGLALRHARLAVERDPQNHQYLDTLAAALAFNELFDEAVKIQQQAIELAWADEGRISVRENYGRRLLLYREGRRYIEKE